MTAPDVIDEYAYLEAQLEGNGRAVKGSNGAYENGRSSKDDRRGRDDRRRRSRSRDKKRSRSRDRRSRSRDRRSSRRSRSRDRKRSKSRDRRRSRSPAYRRERTPPEVRLQRERDKELKELERTTRTVMAMNVNLRADVRDLFGFFSRAGTVVDIKLITDKNKRSKGIAYIEMSTPESAVNAVSLSGQIFMNQAVIVKPSEAEKNLAWEAAQAAKQNQAAAVNLIQSVGGVDGPAKLQVLNLHPEMSDADLNQLFQPFGQVDFAQIAREPTGVSSGYGFVQYATKAMAEKAIQHWNGQTVAGRVLTVVMQPATALPGPPGAFPGLVTAAAPAPAPATIGDLEEEDNFKLNAQSRTALMSRLAASAGLQPVQSFPMGQPQAAGTAMAKFINPALQLEQGVLGPASPIPTPCILLKNMFGPADMTEPDWAVEVTADVKDECSKFGEVLHLHVDPGSKGFVYVKFSTQQAAEAAHRALTGRWYSGNQIVVDYQFFQLYNSHFKC